MTDEISMADFNAAKSKATKLEQSERDDQAFDNAWGAVAEISDSITGRCADCGERLNDAWTVLIVIGNLATSLLADAGYSPEDITGYLESAVFDPTQERVLAYQQSTTENSDD